MRGGKRQAGGLLPRSGKATRSGAAKPRLQAVAQQARLSNLEGTAVPGTTIEVAGLRPKPHASRLACSLLLLEAMLHRRGGLPIIKAAHAFSLAACLTFGPICAIVTVQRVVISPLR